MEFTKENINLALEKHAAYTEAVKQIRNGEKILGIKNQNLESVLKEQQEIQNYLKAYFSTLKDGSKNAVTTATEILQRRTYRLNEIEKDGNERVIKLVNLGIGFLHEQFNQGNIFPLDTFLPPPYKSFISLIDFVSIICNLLYASLEKYLIKS